MCLSLMVPPEGGLPIIVPGPPLAVSSPAVAVTAPGLSTVAPVVSTSGTDTTLDPRVIRILSFDKPAGLDPSPL